MSNTRTRRSKADYVAGQLTNRNYIPFGNFDSVELGTGYINYFQDAAASRPVDGTGGTPAGLTVTRTVTNPLTGASSLLISKDAVNRQGQGFSIDYPIDRKDRASQLLIKMNYELASGTFQNGTTAVDSDLIVYMYDVTNGTLIEPSTFKIDSAVSGITAQFQATFQTASNSVSYRLIFYVPTTNATAWTMSVDELFLGNAGRSTGVQAKAPTVQKFTSGSGTYTTPAGVIYIEVKMVGGGGGGGPGQPGASTAGGTGGTTTFGSSLLTATGGTGGSNAGGGGTGGSTTVSSPAIPLSAFSGTSGGGAISARLTEDIGGGAGGVAVLFPAPGLPGVSGGSGSAGLANTGSGGAGGNVVNTAAVSPGSGGGGAGSLIALIPAPAASYSFTVGAGGTAGTGTYNGGLGGSGYIEVTEYYYGNNVLISDSAASRVVAVKATNSAAINVGPNNTYVKVPMNTATFDTHGAYDTTNSRYVVKVPGTYRISASSYVGGTNTLNTLYLTAIYKNGSLLSLGTSQYPPATGSFGLTATTTDVAVVGDYYEFFLYGGGNNSVSQISIDVGFAKLSVEQIQGPAQIQAATVVAVDADSPTSTHTATAAYMTGFTKRLDTTGSFNAATGIFTAPGPGVYSYTAMYSPQNTALPSSIYAVKNGSILFGIRRSSANSTGTVYPSPTTNGVVQLNTGETLGFFAQNSSGSAITTDNASCISIFRISGIN